MLSWFVLVVSGAFEAVWAVALSKTQGFTRLAPSLVFAAALALSMGGLGYALRQLPLGTAYSVWVGVGAALTVGYGMLFGLEPYSHAKAFLIALIVAAVVGLKLLH
ncbi:hypothetical protein HMPREF9336_01576 [Segniliparus rugosus ATCC BAA-974]|uniref:Ligand-binding protein SH3 n=1 Tax=Segniliparus rugosus (strain ATCC BAA-974 / DSM 45345 / CCUG 50838 / CIP 108380 / JCM 13579 / CDC 945) TaxID=679197 RepID=E5XQ04_SEGRC|nr:hypothetical protein HMPREF9336_01576 [Segniliparus rugosus ATCC BAA-974]